MPAVLKNKLFEEKSDFRNLLENATRLDDFLVTQNIALDVRHCAKALSKRISKFLAFRLPT